MTSKPVLAVTMGDPAGIGPELVVKVLSDSSVFDICRPLVIADPGVMAENVRRLGAGLRFRQIAAVAEARFDAEEIDLLCPPGVQVERIAWGTVDAAMGKAATLCMREAFLLGMAGQVDGVVCAPLNKQAFHLAGYDYFDEVAFLVDLTHSRDAYILGVTDTFWTVAMAEHVTFTRIVDRVKQERILSRTRSLNDCLRRGGWAQPRIAVAALNVHAGEGGLFGREEIDEIEPAIAQARREGLNVEGPVPADTVFVRAREGDFDGVVCMYHDQANIARKLLSTRRGASIYMGLPVIGGTTAHGTAFDKAGQGIAETGSMMAALTFTARLVGS
jgi:4-phospho-D-threonate 3-dehydrogenase / 4-phospho-D-erythronate 3-dehydrogenase